MGDFTALITFSVLILSLLSFQLTFCKKKSWGSKTLKRLSKSEVQVKTYLLPCSFDKEFLNATFGRNHNHLHNCKRKFVIRMTVNSGGEYCSKTDGFIPIDHVIDGITGRKKRLLNPFMVRLKREKMYQLYDLQLVKSVNAEAREEVINFENTPNYTGCDTSSSHPTCGFSFFNNKIIQFSEGFCCSCDQNKNDQRQPCESNSHESKDFPEMEYAVHRHRSNRTSRDLETAQGKSDSLNKSSSGGIQHIADESLASIKLSSPSAIRLKGLDEKVEKSVIKLNIDSELSQNQPNTLTGQNALPVDSCEILKPLVDNGFSLNNATVKTFEFEHSLDKNVGHLYPVFPLNVVIDTQRQDGDKLDTNDMINTDDETISSKTIKLEDSDFDHLTEIEGDLSEYFDTFKHSGNSNNLMDRGKLKLLVMKRIRDNKNHEDVLMNQESHSNETVNPISRKVSREIKNHSNDSRFQRYEYVKKTGKNGFSLRLENDNSELRLQIITKKPKNITMSNRPSNDSQKHRPRKPPSKTTGKTYRPKKKTTENKECKTSSTEHTTKKGLKQRLIQNSVLKYFKSGNKTATTTERLKPSNILCGTITATHPTKNAVNTAQCDKHTNASCDTRQMSNESNSLLLPLNNITKLNSIDLNKCNAAKNTTDLESLMYKLVPVINTIQNLKTADGESCKKADGIVADTDNATYKVYIELKKKSDKTDGKSTKNGPRGKQTSSTKENQANSFELLDSLTPDGHISAGGYGSKYVENRLEEEPVELSRTHLAKNIIGSNHLLDNQLRVQNIQKREAACDTQIRGGQSCSNGGKELPCNGNPETYFESAHCLRFSDLWFNVFKLLNPRLENSITVKIYAKHKTPDKRICWENLSKRLPGRVGTVNEVLTDDGKNIMITYSSDDKVAFNLDCATDYILVPQPLPRYCKNSELKILSYGGPEEYLVLKENEISFDGEECDKAGVNYAAFARQLHRCQQEAGACLRNQPLQYWRKDKEAVKKGKRGQYFLKNFIEVTDQAILQNTTSNQVVLRAPYFERYQSEIIIEMNADHIEIIGDKSEGQITEVYTDATSMKVTIVRAVVTNLGVASDFFGVDFANCSSRLGPSDFDKPGKDEIPPQHRITYTATISSPLKNKRVECKLVLYNQDQELVASRHIIIVQGQRCMCVWYCQCVCYDHPDPGLPCRPLAIRDYNRAGFPGHLPVSIGSDCSTLFTVLHALLWFFLFLLLFGLIKAILGLCSSNIGLWGLWYLLPEEAKSLTTYLEPQYACCPVVRDCDGFPINPRSYRRTEVHFLPWYSEFIVNVFFFVCVFRSCLCDRGSHRDGAAFYYQDPGCYPRSRGMKCSPGCSVRHRSPCGSVCSNRRNRKFRISAGAEEDFLNPDPQLLKDDEWAKRLVDELTRSYIVFRVLTRPMGGVKSVPGTPYCVRGFFQESDNGFYEFTPPSPLMQIWQMDGAPLDPPLRLDPSPFYALYHSAREVLGAHELSPWARGVVINAP